MSRPTRLNRAVRWAAGAALALILAALFSAPSEGRGAEPRVHGCGSFEAQADAQSYFVASGGTPKRNVGHLDGDHDGVACPGLGAPYAGYATLGYNRKRHFLYGVATMPPGEGGGEPPCLSGDAHYPDDARKVRVYRLEAGAETPISRGGFGAEALVASHRLVWKGPQGPLEPGRYVARFEEKIRSSPYGRPECPAFESRPTVLPSPGGSSPAG